MSDQNQPNQPGNDGGGPNPWVKSLMIWGGVFLALLIVVSAFGGGNAANGESIAYSDFRDQVAEGTDQVISDAPADELRDAETDDGAAADGGKHSVNGPELVLFEKLISLLCDRTRFRFGCPAHTTKCFFSAG